MTVKQSEEDIYNAHQDIFRDHQKPALSYEERMARKQEQEAAESQRAQQAPKSEPKTMGLRWRTPEEAPKLTQTKVLLKISSGFVLAGIIFEEGTPGLYDLSSDRYMERSTWTNIRGWLPISELPE